MIASFIASKVFAPLAGGLVLILAVCLGVQSVKLHLANGRIDKLEAQWAKAQADGQKRAAKAAVVSGKVQAKVTEERVRIEYRTKTLIREVPKYVTVQDDARCTINLGFVRLHDAAASGAPELPAPASGSDQAPSGVQLSAVLATITGNYGVAYDWRAEALAWRDWYVAQKVIWEAKP